MPTYLCTHIHHPLYCIWSTEDWNVCVCNTMYRVFMAIVGICHRIFSSMHSSIYLYNWWRCDVLVGPRALCIQPPFAIDRQHLGFVLSQSTSTPKVFSVLVFHSQQLTCLRTLSHLRYVNYSTICPLHTRYLIRVVIISNGFTRCTLCTCTNGNANNNVYTMSCVASYLSADTIYIRICWKYSKALLNIWSMREYRQVSNYFTVEIFSVEIKF